MLQALSAYILFFPFKFNNIVSSLFVIIAFQLVDAPSQFEMALSCLESYKNEQRFDEHICFFGYGDENLDQFMNMVIARFLRDGKNHVTFAQGGYRCEFLSLVFWQ
ncbi:hypothetical protein ANCCAN_15318 [Ancylostoma caninum]|uniref:Uncharacterized protein n=1 Tax=Ancylostoma caninum TaxID=29170 RepID=A0A368G500_ANCCA|nr:hypothetical protein ANCCAN_15318 [Ancylostoma caninum]